MLLLCFGRRRRRKNVCGCHDKSSQEKYREDPEQQTMEAAAIELSNPIRSLSRDICLYVKTIASQDRIGSHVYYAEDSTDQLYHNVEIVNRV
jgi:hypothetical protein